MNQFDLKILQKEIQHLALNAGKILLQYREKARISKRKTDFLDVCSTADIASEKYIISQIEKKYPSHNIISEEKGEINKNSNFTWIIDPLDGTKEFIRGTPVFNVSITLEHKAIIIASSVFRPVSNELFSSSLGNGSFLNGKNIHVSKETELKRSIIWTHLPHYGNIKSETDLIWKVCQYLAQNCYRIRAFQEDVAILSWLALGALEGYILFITTGPKWWDVAPGILMVQEAGGKVTDLKGKTIENRNLANGLIASNGKIHNELLEIVNKLE